MGDAVSLTELRSSGTGDQDRIWRSFRFGLGLAAVFLSTVVVTLSLLAVAATVVPRWHSTVVASGSMEPALRRGDTVVYVERGIDSVGPGTVVVFDDDDTNTSIIHRVAEVNEDGTLVTRGDANQSNDSSPVTATELEGAGRVVVPWVGLLRLWWLDGRHLLVISIMVGVLVSLRATSLMSDPEADPWLQDGGRESANGWLGSTPPPNPDDPTATDQPAELIPSQRRLELLANSN